MLCIVCRIEKNTENTIVYFEKKSNRFRFNSRCKKCSNENRKLREQKKVSELKDSYIIKKLKEQGFKSDEITNNLISLKRTIILIKRELNAKN